MSENYRGLLCGKNNNTLFQVLKILVDITVKQII